MSQTGTLYIVSAPSGAGKSSLLQEMLKTTDDILLSVSYTTRDPRPGEEHGIHYNFTNVETFKQEVEAGNFLEHAQVFDNFYGTSAIWVNDKLASGQDVILEIDWQGAQQIREKVPGTVTIFILPPSREALEERLTRRGQDNAEIIARRMHDAEREMSHYPEYDYLIINDDFETAKEELRTIFLAQRLRLEKQAERHAALLEKLLPA